jgi:hypothetical protein
MFYKGGPGKNHQARLPGALVGLEGLSFILSRTEPWNTVYTHIWSNFSSWGVLMERFNSSPVPPNIRPWNTSSYMASIRGRIYTGFGSADPGRIFYVQIFRCVASATTLSSYSSEEKVISCSGESRDILQLLGLPRLLLHLHLLLLLLLLLEYICSSHIVFPRNFVL